MTELVPKIPVVYKIVDSFSLSKVSLDWTQKPNQLESFKPNWILIVSGVFVVGQRFLRLDKKTTQAMWHLLKLPVHPVHLQVALIRAVHFPWAIFDHQRHTPCSSVLKLGLVKKITDLAFKFSTNLETTSWVLSSWDSIKIFLPKNISNVPHTIKIHQLLCLIFPKFF